MDVFALAFVESHNTPFVRLEVNPDQAGTWAELLGVPARRCYISDQKLVERTVGAGVAGNEIVAATIPDAGSVMSGDFEEIVTAFFFASTAATGQTIDPVRWRYKAQRTKAAPGSDVVQLTVPSWPMPSAEDRILCAEVKAKATASNFDPIAKAAEGSILDRQGRLAPTLVWLKEKVLLDGSETVTVEHLDRFIRAIDYPPVVRDFRAVAVIDSALVEEEIAKGTNSDPADCALVVISIPNLKQRYTEVYDAILAGADAAVALLTAGSAPGPTTAGGP